MKTKFVLILAYFTVFAYEGSHSAKCKYIQFQEMPAENYTGGCTDVSPMCQRVFNISYIDIPPFGLQPELLEKMITKKCCRGCATMARQTVFRNISEFAFEKIKTSDFIYPFLGKSTSTELHGFHFIPIVDVPSMVYITPRYRTVFEELLSGCLNLWPLVVTCLVLAVVSGFIVWVLEMWYNSVEFPHSFLVGMFEGFWWSFVSMTTVGYGDLNVKSLPARLFSVIWILIGIIMFGLTTSLITVELMNILQPPAIQMCGAKVGALNYREYDSSLVVDYGGIVTFAPAWNFFTDIIMLIGMLRRDEISGFVLEKYTLAYVTEYFEWKLRTPEFSDPFLSADPSKPVLNKEHSKEILFFLNTTHRSLKEYRGDKMSYGALVKNKEVYEYFNTAIRDNRMAFNSKVGSEMNMLFPKTDNANLFTLSGQYFVDTMSVLSVMLAAILVFGCCYELWKKRMKGAAKKIMLSHKEAKELPEELIPMED